jgi:hypothetical protein
MLNELSATILRRSRPAQESLPAVTAMSELRDFELPEQMRHHFRAIGHGKFREHAPQMR